MAWWHRSQPQQPQTPRPSKPVDYPDGVAVETSTGVFYILKGKKHRLFSERAVESWSFDLLPGTVESVSKFKSGPPLGFRNGTMVKNIADGKLYLISENKRRHIQSPDVFTKFGFNPEKVIVVSQEEINLHDEGEVLT